MTQQTEVDDTRGESLFFTNITNACILCSTSLRAKHEMESLHTRDLKIIGIDKPELRKQHGIISIPELIV